MRDEWVLDWKSKESSNLYHLCNMYGTALNVPNVPQMVWLGSRTAKSECMKLISFSLYHTICCQFIASVNNNK